jgi:Mg2+/Co2+ transporter CorB
MLTSILIIAFLLVVSAFFSASETSLIGSSNAKLHQYKNKGNKRAGLVLLLREKKDQLIGTVLIGNNIINIVAASMATGIFIKAYGEDGIYIASAVMSVLIILFGEVLPKSFAFKRPEVISIFVAPIFAILVKIFYPINLLFEQIISFFDRVINFFFKDSNKKHTNEAYEVIRGTIAEHYVKGTVASQDKYMISGILDLAELTVYDIMVHRSDVEFININSGLEDIIKKVINSNFSRFPVYEDKEGNIIGILHIKTLIREYEKFKNQQGVSNGKKNFNIKRILLEPSFVPDSRVLKNQLQDFREKKNHIAIVVDEYGAFEGIITLEDILEEIVGQIDDEHDKGKKKVRKIRTGYYEIDADISVRDLNRYLHWELPEDEFYPTIAGLIIKQAGIIPQEGQIFNFFNVQFEIIEMIGMQINIIKAKKLK